MQVNNTGSLHISLQQNTVMNSILNMELVTKNSERVELFISDVSGRGLLHKPINVQAGINNVSINVSGLAPGIYLLYGFGKEGKTNVVRFVKQ